MSRAVRIEQPGAPDGDRVSYATLLAAELGGELEVGSTDGRASFTITLPAPG